MPARFLIDRLEARTGKGRDGYAWDAEAWSGGDIDKLLAEDRRRGRFGGSIETAEVQVLWSHAIDPWFDLQLGAPAGFRPGPDRTHLVAGVQGLAPYWIEVEALAFVSNKGEVSARFEAEHDVRLTQSLDPPAAGGDRFLAAGRSGPPARRGPFDRRARRPPALRDSSAFRSRRDGSLHRRTLSSARSATRRAFGGAAGDDAGGWRILAGIRTWF